MITTIKIIHTTIWIVMASAVIYILYAGITNTFNTILWIAIGLILLEGVVLLINKWTCPLTPLAEKYTSNREPNFDIYLPKWLAKHNKTIFTSLFIIGLLLVIINLIRN